MSVYKAEDYKPISFSEGHLTIAEAMKDPASVQLYYNENGKYYVTSESVMNYMMCSATTEIREAIEQIAEVNDIDESSIECVGRFDAQFKSKSDALCEAVVLEKSMEDDAMNLKQAQKFYSKVISTCKSKADTVEEVDDCIKMLKDCVKKMERAKDTGSGSERVKYALKDMIPFNSIYRIFKHHDWMAGVGALTDLLPIPGAGIITRAVTYNKMLEGQIKNANSAIEYLENKKKDLEGEEAAKED